MLSLHIAHVVGYCRWWLLSAHFALSLSFFSTICTNISFSFDSCIPFNHAKHTHTHTHMVHIWKCFHKFYSTMIFTVEQSHTTIRVRVISSYTHNLCISNLFEHIYVFWHAHLMIIPALSPSSTSRAHSQHTHTYKKVRCYCCWWWYVSTIPFSISVLLIAFLLYGFPSSFTFWLDLYPICAGTVFDSHLMES